MLAPGRLFRSMLGSLGPGARLASSEAAAAVATAAAAPKAAFVKLGGGEYYELAVPWADLAGMNKNTLLTALQKDGFDHILQLEAFPKCRVTIIQDTLSTSKDMSDVADEPLDMCIPLVGSQTIGSALAEVGSGSGGEGPLFIRVTLPATAASHSAVAAGGSAYHAFPRAYRDERMHNDLLDAKLVDIPGQPPGGCQLLVLPDKDGKSRCWPGLSGNTLLVRPVYREFYEREDLLNRFRPRAAPLGKRMFLHGSMGSGKTAFGLYCLWRAGVVDERNVVYAYPAGVTGYLVFENDYSSKTVSIGDNIPPFPGADLQLMLSSPPLTERDVKHFEKTAETLFMPEPTEEEMRLMRDASFSYVSDTELKDRISRWGRAPRMVLRREEYIGCKWRSVESWMGYQQPGTLPELLLRESLLSDMVFYVLHYGFGFDTAAPYSWPPPPGAPPRDYKKAYRRWASPEIEAAMAKCRLLAEDHEQLKALAAAAPLELRRWERHWLHGFPVQRIE